MYKLAVIGNPIEHSLSPLVFSLFANECGIQLDYKKILAKDEVEFEFKVREFFASGGLAINVTSPFKMSAYKISDIHTARSEICCASNLLSQTKSKEIISETTDGIGLIRDIYINKNQTLTHKDILIIGSGFVVDSILPDLIEQNPRSIDILARNTQRLQFLHQKYRTANFEESKKYDIIINTSPNIEANILFDHVKFISDSALCYDMNYKSSLFLDIMQIRNQTIVRYNGLGMLVEQARVAFIKLFSKTPDQKLVFDELLKMGYYV